MSVLPGAEPYSHQGGPTAVLLCHGFTGCPQSLRPWAEYLAGQGLTVSLPRLPGHGTTWQEMARTRWEDWYAEVDRAFGELQATASEIFVMGLSMGGCLALRLAELHGPAVSGTGPGQPVGHRRHQAVPARAGDEAGRALAQGGRQRHQEGGRHRARLRPHADEGRRDPARAVEGDAAGPRPGRRSRPWSTAARTTMSSAPAAWRSCARPCRPASSRSGSAPTATTSRRWTTTPRRSLPEAWISFVLTAMRERNDRMDVGGHTRHRRLVTNRRRRGGHRGARHE